jgi:hypothetical protein
MVNLFHYTKVSTVIPLRPALVCFGWLVYDGDCRRCMGLFRGIYGVKHDLVKAIPKHQRLWLVSVVKILYTTCVCIDFS